MTWPGGTARLVLDAADSSLNEAERRFDTLPGPTWILVLKQTSARGRRGRVWHQPSGNFAGTYVTRVEGGAEKAALRSFTASLALHDAFVAVTGRAEPFALKWPNDVLINGGKVAGILLESIQRKGRMVGVGVGVGINLAEAPPVDMLPPEAVRPVSLFGETGVIVTPEDFLTPFAAAMAHYEVQLEDYGFAAIREAWLARAARIGEEIVARTGTSETRGIFETVDQNGHLVLKTASGRQSIAAADVYF
ncbi:biotin--acetyl-CoA-carboxylase ligase [Oceanicola sp. 22II-s10i]|uniref:biotin--[acetyl-CoA-carboxylase] ligase n=1 Tax=Oceanicola sp. 22II-s10i TaxID=1317116 RepID=UPI000B5225AF|nr:biotin--[acetyl-CoA-carboxylase] ligase [Oceanicola sp. 22II-s10i]OWU83643.1 biotin--acetyl-CoA-carboxylase ligase [Oceanicola sp. 22II-s10i]